MSDHEEEEEEEKPFFAERAKTGRANCKKCKEKLENGELRIAKLVTNPFGSGKLKHWYHVNCLFESFEKQRATTKRLESSDDIDGWSNLNDLDRDLILEKIPSASTSASSSSAKNKTVGGIKADFSSHASTSAAPSSSVKPTTDDDDDDDNLKSIVAAETINKHYRKNSKDNLFREFRRICADISNESSYLGKTKILHTFLLKGSNGANFEGDMYLWIKLLLPGAVKRVYNLASKQLVKLFSRIFRIDVNDMLEHLEQGDVSETVRTFFESSKKTTAAAKSLLNLEQVDTFLEELAMLTKEDEQVKHFGQFCKLCTTNDLKTVIRLIKHDLRINTGPKHILEALSSDAYPAFQSSRDLHMVVKQYGSNIPKSLSSPVKKKDKIAGIQLMCPVSPMLAEACKSVERAMEKYPQGMYSEVKYDGERVQLHKRGNEFKFFSRNLKPVQDHKISRCKEFIPKAFPLANELILDSEILVVDMNTGELLPFGTLGVHKKTQFKSAEVCLFVFDCIFYNGEDLSKKPLRERRKILEENIRPVKHHVQLSEYQFVTTPKQLRKTIAEVLKKGLEGLVLKCPSGIYEPGKRHWLKVKKDYLFEGKMADSADLVVFGGWFGTGKKGGMLSIFLMGCYDKISKLWKTVTKVHSGLDDKTMEDLQETFKKLMRRSDPDNPPKWLSCKKSMVPDFLACDPYKMPVWEITGAEFSKADIHTADGISIRFPRITKFRDDKTTKEATNLAELNILYTNSKESIDLKLLEAPGDSQEETGDDLKKLKIKTEMKSEKNMNIMKKESSSRDEARGDSDGNEDYNSKGNENVGSDDADNHGTAAAAEINLKNKFKIKKEDVDSDKDGMEDDDENDDDVPKKGRSQSKGAAIDKSNVLGKSDDSHQKDDVKKYGNFYSPAATTTTTVKDEKSKKQKHSNRDTSEHRSNDMDSEEATASRSGQEKKRKPETNRDEHGSKNDEGGSSSDRRRGDGSSAGGGSDIRMKNDPGRSKKKMKYLFDDTSNDDDSVVSRGGGDRRKECSHDAHHGASIATRRRNDNDDTAASGDNNEKQSHFSKSSKRKFEKLLINQDLSDAEAETMEGGTKKFEKYAVAMDNKKTEEDEDVSMNTNNNNVFAGVKVHVPHNVRTLLLGDETDKFIEMGGTILNDTRKCTHVLHKDEFIAEDISLLRSLYNPVCRHIKYNWLVDSIENEKIMDVTKYPITLRTSTV